MSDPPLDPTRNLGCDSLAGSIHIVLDQPLHGVPVEVELGCDGLHGLTRMPQVEARVERHIDTLDDRPTPTEATVEDDCSVELAQAQLLRFVALPADNSWNPVTVSLMACWRSRARSSSPPPALMKISVPSRPTPGRASP